MKSYDPEFRRIVDWVDANRDRIDASLPWSDPNSIETAMWMESFLQLAAELPLPEPPPIVRQRLRQSFARLQHVRAKTASTTYIPELLVDTRVDRELIGVRGTTQSTTPDVFQLVLRAPVATVFLEIAGAAECSRTLSGQVILSSFGPPVFEATAVSEGLRIRSVYGNGNGEFRLENVPDDSGLLLLDNGQICLRIELGRITRPL